MRWLILSLGVLLISACASIDTAKQAIAIKGAEISDQALTDAVWWTCQGSSVGAVKRMYGQTAERAALYREFCEGSGTANVVKP